MASRTITQVILTVSDGFPLKIGILSIGQSLQKNTQEICRKSFYPTYQKYQKNIIEEDNPEIDDHVQEDNPEIDDHVQEAG